MKNPLHSLFRKGKPAPFVPPPPGEIIAACHESLAVYRENGHPDVLCLAYTPTGLYRAAILRKGRMYQVQYSSLRIMDADDMHWEWQIHGSLPPETLAHWEEDPGESWFDDASSAEGTALSVLAQLEPDGDSGPIEYFAKEGLPCN